MENGLEIREVGDVKDEEVWDIQSKSINFLRPILICFVVFMHANCEYYSHDFKTLLERGDFEVYGNVSKYLHDYVFVIAVPIFYFFSGYLFFLGIQSFNFEVYSKKVKSRVKSIVIPYIFWNLFYLVLFYVGENVIPERYVTDNYVVTKMSFTDWLWCFWDYGRINSESGNFPFNSAFWFIRDLFVVVLLSPLINFMLNKFGYYFVIILFGLYIYDFWIRVTGFNSNALVFFSFGGYFAVKSKYFTEVFGKYRLGMLVYPVTLVLMYIYMGEKWNVMYVRGISIISGLVFMVSVTRYLIKRGYLSVIKFMTESTFFVFAYHIFVISFISRVIQRYLEPKSDLYAFFVYFSSSILTIIFGILIYFGLKRFFPRFTSFIVGGR